MAHILDSKTLNPKNYSFKDTFYEKTNRKTRVWICNHTDDKFVYSWGDKKTIDDLKVFMSNCEKAMKEGKHLGMDNQRPIMPPMPWQGLSMWPDEDLKAVFAYLKSIPPIDNLVPAYQPAAM